MPCAARAAVLPPYRRPGSWVCGRKVACSLRRRCDIRSMRPRFVTSPPLLSAACHPCLRRCGLLCRTLCRIQRRARVLVAARPRRTVPRSGSGTCLPTTGILSEGELNRRNRFKINSFTAFCLVEGRANPSISLACGARYEQLIIRWRSETHDPPKSSRRSLVSPTSDSATPSSSKP